MGMFTFPKPISGSKGGVRLLPRGITKPVTTTLTLYEGHISPPGAHILDEVQVDRWYKAPDVSRLSIREGQLRATLFLPPGMR